VLNMARLCPIQPKSGECPSTTSSEKVALWPFMSEVCLLLCGRFLALANSEKERCYGFSKNENGKGEKIFPLPPGGGGTVAGNGRNNCRRVGIIVDAKDLSQYPDIEAVDKHHQTLFKYQRDNNIIWDDMTVLGYKAE